MEYLNSKGFDTLVTFRGDGLCQCPLKSDKVLKKAGRDLFDCKTEQCRFSRYADINLPICVNA